MIQHFFQAIRREKTLQGIFLLGFIAEIFWASLFLIPKWWPDPSMPVSLRENINLLGIVFAAATFVYATGYFFIRKKTVPYAGAAIFIWGAIFSITLAFLPPLGSADALFYITTGRVASIGGMNPYVVPSAGFQDPSLLTQKYNFSHQFPLTYGPLWGIVEVVLTFIGRSDIWFSLGLFRALSIASSLGSVLILHRIIARIHPGFETAALFLLSWNPLWLFETANNAHNESFMIFLLLVSLLNLLKKSWMKAIIFLTLSSLVKYVYIILIPLYLLFMWYGSQAKKEKIKHLVQSAVSMGAVSILLYAPFWVGLKTFEGFRLQSKIFFPRALPPLTFLIYKGGAWLQNGISTMGVERMTRGISMVIFLLLFAVIFIMTRNNLRLKKENQEKVWIAPLLAVVGAFLFLMPPTFLNWYLLWPIPLLIAWKKEQSPAVGFIFVLTIASMLSYIITRNSVTIPFMFAMVAWVNGMLVRKISTGLLSSHDSSHK